MSEEVLATGIAGGYGLLTRAHGASSGLCAVLFNAGLVHRAGPQRFNVDLARRLAANGHDVFRFDLPGIGDAATGGATETSELASHVFDLLQATTGARAFFVGGICSAADLGWRSAVADTRVAGLLLIDPFAARGGWYHVGRIRRALRAPLRSWPGKLRRHLPWVAGPGEAASDDYRDWPGPDEFRRQAAGLLSRGVRILAIYTGGVADYLLDRRQIDDTYGTVRRHSNLRVEFEPAFDHIFYAASDRREVMERVVDWSASLRQESR